ncbi:MAG: hypothetical protein WAW77_14415, partial [Caldibacillus thermoamylovorans]
GKSLASLANKFNNKNSPNSLTGSGGSGGGGNKPPSPNDKDKSMKPKNQEQSVAFSEMSKGENQAAVTTESGQEQEEKGRFSGSGGAGSIAQLAEEQNEKGNRRNQVKAPSPNDTDRATISPVVNGSVPSSSGGSHSVQKAQGVQKSSIQTDTDITSVADRVQGNSSVSNTQIGGSPSNVTERPTSVHNGSGSIVTQNGSQSVQRAQNVQKSSVQTDTSVTSVADQVQGSTFVSSVQSGSLGATTSSPVNAQNSTGNTPITSDSHSVQNVQGVQKSSVQTDVEASNMTEQVQGKTTTSTTQTGSSSSQNVTPTNVGSSSNSVKNVNGPRSVETTKVVQNSTVQSDLEVASTTEQVQGGTVKTNTNTVRSDDLNSIKNQSYERKRPRTYSIGSNSENTIKKIKSYKKIRDIEI